MARNNNIGMEIGTYVTSVFTPFAQVESIDGFEVATNDLDYSEIVDAWDLHGAGSKSLSPINFVVHFDSSIHDDLFNAVGVNDDFYVEFSDFSLVKFAGYIATFKVVGGDNKSKSTASITIQPSGAPTWAASTTAAPTTTAAP